MKYAYILQWTPFPGRWEHLPEWQLQTAEWELKLGRRYYYEHAIRTNNGFLYPVEIAQRIINYWAERWDFAKYRFDGLNLFVNSHRAR